MTRLPAAILTGATLGILLVFAGTWAATGRPIWDDDQSSRAQEWRPDLRIACLGRKDASRWFEATQYRVRYVARGRPAGVDAVWVEDDGTWTLFCKDGSIERMAP